MATLYFNGAVDSDWNEIGNWWTSAAFATQASALPTSSDNVVLSATCDTNNGSTPTVVNLTYTSGYLGTGVIITGTATFNDGAYNDIGLTGNPTYNGGSFNNASVTGNPTYNTGSYNGAGVTGNPTFNDSSYSDFAVTGDATFNDTSINYNTVSNNATFNGDDGSANAGSGSRNEGTVTNNATFNESSYNNTGGTVGNLATFNSRTYNSGTVYSAIFNNTSYNSYAGSGVVTTDATFNNSSYNGGTVSGNAIWSAAAFTNFVLGTVSGTITFSNASSVVFTTDMGNAWTYDSSLWNFTTVGPTWIFNDTNTYNSGTLNGDATFNDVSNNTGTVSGNATFDDNAYNNGGTITGNATFYLASSNQTGTVSGSATFNDTSHNDATVSTNATFNSGTYNTYTGVVSVDATFNGTAFNDGTVTNDAIFNNGASQGGTVSGNATFNGAGSANRNTVSGNAIFNNSSFNDYNGGYGIVAGNATFNDTAYNAGTVSGNATWSAAAFTNFSLGTVSSTITFSAATAVVFTTNGGNGWGYDSSLWTFTTPNPTWIFNGVSTYNSGTLQGDATFNGSSSNQGVVAGTTTFNDNSGCTAAASFDGNITVNYPVPVPLNSNGNFGTITSLGIGVGITYAGYSTPYLSWNPATAPINTWTHIAFVRIGGICRLYADGVTVLNFSNNVDLGASHTVTIGTGAHNLGENFPGYIDEVRISSSGIYNGDFSPPTSPLTDDSSLLLLHFDGNMTDSSSHSLTVGGTATTTASESKFGGSSINTSSSYAEIGNNALFGFGTGDFTIEMWIYPTSVSSVGGLINIGTYDNGILIRHGSANDTLYMSGSRTLYYNNGYGQNNEWNDQNNWFFDTNYSYLPSFIPTSADNVIANNNIFANGAGQPTVKNFSSTGCIELGINLTVTEMATFTCYNPNAAITVGTTLTGNATFNGFASPAGTVTGSGIFNDGTHNDGTVGYGVFNDTSSNGLNGGLGGNSIGYVTNNAIFNDSSTNGGGQNGSKGIVSGNAIFNDSSVNNCYYDLNDVGATPETGDGFVHGSATFRGQSKNQKGVGGSVILAYDKGINGSNILGIF